MNPLFLIGFVLGYGVGSIPTAFLLVKWKTSLDIRAEGSGNVGTLNSFNVTKSKSVGIAVLLLDVLKGASAVMLGFWISNGEFVYAAAAGIGAVVGHNFPIWLGFKGGRGLAPAAGVLLVLGWLCVALWGVFWILGFLVSKKVNVGNAIATVLLMLAIAFSPGGVLEDIFPWNAAELQYRMFGVCILLIILVRHVGPLQEYFRQRRSQSGAL